MPRKKPSDLKSSHHDAVVSEPVVTEEAPAATHDVEVAVPVQHRNYYKKSKIRPRS